MRVNVFFQLLSDNPETVVLYYLPVKCYPNIVYVKPKTWHFTLPYNFKLKQHLWKINLDSDQHNRRLDIKRNKLSYKESERVFSKSSALSRSNHGHSRSLTIAELIREHNTFWSVKGNFEYCKKVILCTSYIMFYFFLKMLHKNIFTILRI